MKLTSLETNASLMELTVHGTKEFPIQYYFDVIEDYELGHIPWHWHPEFELLSVLNGTVTCFIGRHKTFVLHPGDGLFINSGVLHRFESTQRGVNAVTENIVFSPEFIAPSQSDIYLKYVLPFLSELQVSHMILLPTIAWQKKIMIMLSEIYKFLNEKPDLYEMNVQQLINTSWQLLYKQKETLIKLTTDSKAFTAQVRVKQMISFIEQHYDQSLTLDDIASSANISKTETLRCFKLNLNHSPIQYLNQYRLHQGAQLLLTSKKSVSEIAMCCGFTNVGYFNRLFKRTFNVSPTEYRKKTKQNKEIVSI